MPQYSPERRTALVLCGTGVHGAYHAGVLRALQEAGVKIDIVAGQGIGAAGAALAALDGAGRLTESDGVWRTPSVATLYGWKRPLVFAAQVAAAGAALLLLLAAGAGDLVPPLAVRVVVLAWAAAACAAAAWAAVDDRREPSRRRARGAWPWRLLGAPFDARAARALFTGVVRALVQDGRYSEVLAESLGQPGFREVMFIVTDLDARRDVVAAMLRDPYRRDFFAARPGGERRAEVIDLAAPGRDHAMDIVAAALTPPLGCEPHQLTFAQDGFWRGETHRLCDRPAAVSRLLEELAAAGASQAIIVSAVPPQSAPHRLRGLRLDLRSRLADHLAAAEAAALRDAMEMARLRFDCVYLISPSHNPIGAFDFAGAYDEASDRRQEIPEFLERAYEDAYRQFIEPVVGASGEHLARAASRGTPDAHARLFDDADPRR